MLLFPSNFRFHSTSSITPLFHCFSLFFISSLISEFFVFGIKPELFHLLFKCPSSWVICQIAGFTFKSIFFMKLDWLIWSIEIVKRVFLYWLWFFIESWKSWLWNCSCIWSSLCTSNWCVETFCCLSFRKTKLWESSSCWSYQISLRRSRSNFEITNWFSRCKKISVAWGSWWNRSFNCSHFILFYPIFRW